MKKAGEIGLLAKKKRGNKGKMWQEKTPNCS